jgi:hypothetical protein
MDAKQAIEQRAKYKGWEYYPMQAGKSPSVFAVRYFNAEMDEVGYHIPDVGGWYEFVTPRKWSKENVRILSRHRQVFQKDADNVL